MFSLANGQKPRHVPRLFFWCLLAMVSWSWSFVYADEEASRPFRVRRADGEVVVGSLRQITDKWDIGIFAMKSKLVPNTELISVRQQKIQLPELPSGPQVCLTSGGRLCIDPKKKIDLRDEHLSVSLARTAQPKDKGPIRIYLAFVECIWFKPPNRVPDASAFRRQFLESRRRQDVVLKTTGDRISGTVLNLSHKDGCKLRTSRDTVDIPFGQIAAIGFNSNLLTTPLRKGKIARCVLAGGERITLQSAKVVAKTDRIVGQLVEGNTITFPVSRLLGLQLENSRATYLSDLKATKFAHTPFLSVRWNFCKNRNVVGKPLRLSDGVHDRGIGMHSASRLTYELDGKYSWFEAKVGLDLRTGRRGNVDVSVVCDGRAKIVWKANLGKKQRERDVRLNVQGAQTLTLCVDFGRYGDVGDHVNWANARLVK